MATEALTLRRGDARDIAEVDAVMATAFEPRFGEAWTRNQCMGVLAMPGVRLTLASHDGVAAGFALVRTVLDEGELLLLAVAPALRRRGVARGLLGAVVCDARETGLAALHLEVRAGNAASLLYERAGFARVGERRGYYRGRDGAAFDAHSYRLSLSRD